MQYKFQDWVAAKRLQLMEAALPTDMQPNNFLHFDQKEGDFVYFGIHDLAKMYAENGSLPHELDVNSVVAKSGQIIDADPVRGVLKVVSARAPFHYGYKRLEDKKVRDTRKKKGIERVEVEVPKYYLEDITSWTGVAGLQSGRRLWLVIDRSTRLQRGLYEEIQRHKLGLDKPQGPPTAADVSQQDMDHVRNVMGLTGQGAQAQMQEPSPLNFNQLFGQEPKAPPLQRFTMTNRHVSPQEDPLAQMRQGASQAAQIRKFRPQQQQQMPPQLDIACYQPGGINPWKKHNDNRVYEYYRG